MSKLVIDLKVGETLTIGESTIRLDRKSGQLARLIVTADEGVPISTPSQRRKAGQTENKHAESLEFQRP